MCAVARMQSIVIAHPGLKLDIGGRVILKAPRTLAIGGYSMARGLVGDEAVSTIVRGFLNVKIEGLRPALEEEMEQAIQASGQVL